MKKIIAICLLISVLSAAFLTTVSATDDAPVDSLADHQIVYYDFEGDTLEEQLADKATAGKSKDNLTLTSTPITTVNAEGMANTTLSPNTRVEGGMVYIDPDINDRVECVFDLTSEEEDALGADIFANATGEMTVFIQFKMEAGNNQWIDFLNIRGIGRYIMEHPSNPSAAMTACRVRHKGSNSYQPTLKDAIYVYGTIMTFAVSYQYDSTTQKLNANVMYTQDGEFWTECASEYTEVASFFTDAKAIYMGHSHDNYLNRNGFVIVDEFQMYDKALTLTEVKTLLPSEDTGDDSNDESDDSNSSTESTQNTTSTTAPNTQDATTTAPATDSQPQTEEKKSGCSSVVAEASLGLLALVLGVGLVSKKRKD